MGLSHTRWYLIDKTTKRPRIRRWKLEGGKRTSPEDFPFDRFKKHVGEEQALENFLIRLNGRNPAQERREEMYKIEHAFISPKLLEEYEHWLTLKVPNSKNARRNFGYLKNKVLGYFVDKLGLPDFLQWKRNELKWGKHLRDLGLSGAAIKQIVIEANRFLAWLHALDPEEVPPLKLDPVDRHWMKKHEAQRKLNNRTRQSRYIPRAQVEAIISKIKSQRVRAAARLAHNYGLREAEVVGLLASDVWTKSLQVQRQLLALPERSKPEYGPLKGKESRKVPHWFCKATEAQEWIQIIQANLVTANTLCQLWKNEMDRLDVKMRFHDLRHCFATDAQRVAERRDVQLAMGHKQSSTLDKYTHDDRQEDDDRPLKVA